MSQQASAQAAPVAAADTTIGMAAPAARGFNTKLWLVVGAGVLSVATLGAGTMVWLWPTPAHAKRAVPVAAAASAAAASAADDAAHAVAEPPHGAASVSAAGAHAPPQAAASAATVTEVSAEAGAASRAAAPGAMAASAAQAAAADEDPMDHLRRRLDQKLGLHLQPMATPGELRLLTRPGAPPLPAGPAGAKTAQAASWSYEGKAGPQAWGRLDAQFSACAKGKRQSPIDIRDGVALDLEPLRFDYKPSAFTVIDNGHTVQVNVAAGNWIELRGKRWQLLQFHFHRPSEERIDGKRFDMVVHLVHADDAGHLAVVAVLLQRGAAQPLLRAVWNDLPLEKGEEVPARAAIDLNRLLPEDRRYYTYMGSLTMPPCSEGVLWMVMRAPLAVAASDVGIFARLYPMNARPVQPSFGRLIKQSD